MPVEIELKLAMTAPQLARLRRHPLLRSLAGGRRARRLELRAIYYDTPDRRLAAEKLALRLRGEGRRIVQTLKAPVAGAGGLQRLEEQECEVPDWRLDLARIEDPALAARLAEPGVGDALVPIFETRVLRRLLTVRLLESEIEVAFDEGEVVAGERSLPICEAELELKEGRPERLYQLALTLFEQIDFRLERRSKAARGHALLAPERLGPATAAKVELSPAATAGEAFTAIARSCLEQLTANEAALLAGSEDPEAVHQFRVAVRRLRAALSLFAPLMSEAAHAALSGELDWLQSAMGPPRDWDVFALETLDPLLKRLDDETALKRLAERVAGRRREARAAATAVLRERRYTALLLRLEMMLEDGSWRRDREPGDLVAPAEEPAEVFARAELGKRVRRLLKRGRKRDEADADSLHRLRIAGKKLRYALEFFRGLLPKVRCKAALAALKSLQASLGSLNDAEVGRRLLERAGETGSRPLDARALGIVAGWSAARIETDLGHLQEAWKRTRKALSDLPLG